MDMQEGRETPLTEAPEAMRLKGLRVLVVEDEALVALQLEDMLSELGCTVVGPASRVGQGLDLLGTETVDAAVLDLNVAGELVYPVAKSLADQGCPFIFVTGYGASGVAADYRDRQILQKPILLGQLRKAMLAAVPARPSAR
jgi:CheY-like chemotaxis protein